MSIEELYEGTQYTVEENGNVDVPDNQLSIEEVESEEDQVE
ncbi:hypothetical protein [Rossellomorea aquimaris]|nr:hypothetical protein [Rossellomorea aquimaris]